MGRGGSFHTSTDSVDVVGSLHVSLPMAALGIKFPNNKAIVTADGGVATMLLCLLFKTPILTLKLGIFVFNLASKLGRNPSKSAVPD